ncbi:MAG: PepSY domain-containing protein [Bacteroidales bacterium]|nr:PepSY domain-containing protein [Bacteroidales bacterium]
MSLRTFWRKTHLIIGLVSGLVVFISSITGALYVFKDEVESLTHTFRHVESDESDLLLPSEVFAVARQALPDTQIHGAIYNGKSQVIEVIYYQESPLYYGAAYVHPSSGEVVKQVNFLRTFFGLVLAGHTSLWLPPTIGMPIIAVSVIMYLILLISGIILWWPKGKKRNGVFTFTKTNKFLIKIKEWHVVFGFYATFFVLIMLLTGAVWLFKGFERGVYRSFGGQKELGFSYPKSDISQAGTLPSHVNVVDSVFQLVSEEFGKEANIEIHDITDAESSILVEVNRKPGTYWQMDYLYYDQYTLAELTPEHIYGRYKNADMADTAIRLNYDIHSGGVGGLLGKLLAFLVCILSASFPVTGFLYWWKRTRESKKRKKEFMAELE